MTELPDNILHLPQYQVLGCKSTDDEMHFQVDVPDPIACEECGVQGEFVRFGKRDVPGVSSRNGKNCTLSLWHQ